MKNDKTLVTDLVGTLVKPKYVEQIGSVHGTWPVNDPNVNGTHTAIVRAAWIDKDGSLAIIANTPMSGIMFQTYATNVLIVR